MKNEITDSAGIVTAQSADYEYNTLMRLLGVSVSKHLLDEHFTLVWANDFYYELIGWPKEEYGCGTVQGFPGYYAALNYAGSNFRFAACVCHVYG